MSGMAGVCVGAEGALSPISLGHLASVQVYDPTYRQPLPEQLLLQLNPDLELLGSTDVEVGPGSGGVGEAGSWLGCGRSVGEGGGWLWKDGERAVRAGLLFWA